MWQLALEYIDLIYEIADLLPRIEEYNLRSQIIRAATLIALNIAEGSTGQTNNEQSRFIGLAIRSLLETIACQRLIDRRGYLSNKQLIEKANAVAETLAAKLHTFRKAIAPDQPWIREESPGYFIDGDKT